MQPIGLDQVCNTPSQKILITVTINGRHLEDAPLQTDKDSKAGAATDLVIYRSRNV